MCPPPFPSIPAFKPLTRIDANLTTTILNSKLFPRPSTGNETLDTFNVTGHVASDTEFVYVFLLSSRLGQN